MGRALPSGPCESQCRGSVALLREDTLNVVPVIYSIVTIPQNVAGRARMTTDGPRLIIPRHQQIDEHSSEQGTDDEIAESEVHLAFISISTLPAFSMPLRTI